MRESALTPVEGVPEFTFVDALAADMSGAEHHELLAQLAPIHGRYFPSYPHVLEELERCAAAAADDGEDIVAVIVESDGPHLVRWHELGFFTADADYHEPIHGRHWREHGEPAFFDRYSACVRPWGRGEQMARSVLAERALSALLVDHYGLPADHPQVLRSRAAAASA